MTLTLGGFSPLSKHWILPSRDQLWWKPCLRRAEGETGPHVWYLSPTSDGSLLCPACRTVKVVVGPKAWISQIRTALELGDLPRVRELVARGPVAVDETPAAPEKPQPKVDVFRPRDRDDWMEFFTERAAIFEYVGGMSRERAESAARELAGARP